MLVPVFGPWLALFGRGECGAAVCDGVLKDVAEVYTCMIKVFRAVIEILRIDEYTDALFWMFDYCHT